MALLSLQTYHPKLLLGGSSVRLMCLIFPITQVISPSWFSSKDAPRMSLAYRNDLQCSFYRSPGNIYSPLLLDYANGHSRSRDHLHLFLPSIGIPNEPAQQRF